MAKARLAGLFGIAPEKVHIRSPFLGGGGFDGKGLISGPQVLGFIAAHAPWVGRSSSCCVASRCSARWATVRRRGRSCVSAPMMTARWSRSIITPKRCRAHSMISSSRLPTFRTRSMRPQPSRRRLEGVRADIGTPLFMRAPGEAPGSIALESAIDEMAQACDMDPLAFRLKNYAEVEPISGRPFSSKALRECYRQGAERAVCSASRSPPRKMRDARRPARRLGHGHGDVSGDHVCGPGQGAAATRRQWRHGDRRA